MSKIDTSRNNGINNLCRNVMVSVLKYHLWEIEMSGNSWSKGLLFFFLKSQHLFQLRFISEEETAQQSEQGHFNIKIYINYNRILD